VSFAIDMAAVHRPRLYICDTVTLHANFNNGRMMHSPAISDQQWTELTSVILFTAQVNSISAKSFSRLIDEATKVINKIASVTLIWQAVGALSNRLGFNAVVLGSCSCR
jgi:hypothetical protein